MSDLNDYTDVSVPAKLLSNLIYFKVLDEKDYEGNFLLIEKFIDSIVNKELKNILKILKKNEKKNADSILTIEDEMYLRKK